MAAAATPRSHHKRALAFYCGRLVAVQPEGDARVGFRSNRSVALAALALAAVLSGCAGSDYDSTAWFSKPLNLFGNNLGYSYSQLDADKRERRITANDLVDANGACPVRPQQPQPAPGGPDGNPEASPDAISQLNGGIGVGMSECDVVSRVGAPSAVNLGRNSNGERTAVLNFNGGPRPGVYRFVAGRLTEMDRVEAPAPPPEEAKKPEKKKSAKAKKPAKKDDNG